MSLEWHQTESCNMKAEKNGFVFLIDKYNDGRFRARVIVKRGEGTPVTEYENIPDLKKAKDFCEGVALMISNGINTAYNVLEVTINGKAVYRSS